MLSLSKHGGPASALAPSTELRVTAPFLEITCLLYLIIGYYSLKKGV